MGLDFIDLLKLRFKGYLTVDNFFPDEICNRLRSLALHNESIDYKWGNYVARDFDKFHYSSSLRNIADRYVHSQVSFLKKDSYIRSWSFLYDNKGPGGDPHIDPGSVYTCNTWVTPDECVDDKNNNGFYLYHKRVPKKYIQYDYDNNVKKIYDFIKNSKRLHIPYKYNRAIIFKSNTFHETASVSMKPGHYNRRISYTFLYGS